MKIKWHRANARVRGGQRGFTIFANIASNRPYPTPIYFVLLPALVRVLSFSPFSGAIRRHPLIPIDENKDKLLERERERRGGCLERWIQPIIDGGRLFPDGLLVEELAP